MTEPVTRRGEYERSTESGGTPRWVVVLGIVVIIAALLIVSVMFLGGGSILGHTPKPH